MSSRKPPQVAILGRTNVGKSTLFNALCRGRDRIVEDYSGVTRDRAHALVSFGDLVFTLVDTGGILGESEDPLAGAVHVQSTIALEEAQIVIAVLDGLAGVHPDDAELARILRTSGKPIIWVVNKCEKPSTVEEAVEFHALGIDQYVCISAVHRQNLHELFTPLREQLESLEYTVADEDDEDAPLRLAIIGRPNVGKSSLVNRIVGGERVIESEIPGTTRDSIDVELVREGNRYTLVDTAGLRKKSQIPHDSLERYSNLRSLHALARCDVAAIVLDATQYDKIKQTIVSDQDRRIANLVHRRGIPLVLIVNKWDLIEKDNTSVKEFTKKVFERLNFCTYAPLLFVSALTGRRCPKILETASEVFESSGRRMKTSELNRVLIQAFQKNPPPVHRGHAVKLFFATQVSSLPPTVVLFMNYPKTVTQTYERYLKRKLQEHFSFKGTDIKLHFRKRKSEDEEYNEYDAAGVIEENSEKNSNQGDVEEQFE